MRKINPLIKYYFYQLFNSIVFIVLNVLILVSSIITIILPYYLRCEFLNNCSFIIAIVFQLLIIIYLLFISIKLFNENKHNLSDVKLLGKNFFRNQMFWAKTIVITSCAIIVGLSMCILATFTMLGLHVNNNTIAAIFTSNFIGLVIDILVVTPILIILSLLLGRIWSPIISLLVVLIAPITSCISNFLLSNTNKCNNIDKNINDNSSLIQYDKIYQFDSNNKLIDSVYAYNVNFNQFANTNTNTDIVNSINYVNKFNYLIPGNITMAAQQAIYSKIDDNINLFNYLKYSGSLVRYVPNHFENLSNYINTGNSYILTNMNDNNFFNLNADQLNIDIIQMVRMMNNGEPVKMSKRTGNAVTIQDLIDEIGVDATRYFFVSKAANTTFDFDLALAKSKSNENPVYYAQYAHARMCSIKAQAAKLNLEYSDHYELLVNPKEIELVKHINEFRNIVIDSAVNRTPHKIANYIQRLAQLFHSFYNECYVIDKDNLELSKQRLALVEASRITLANALNLIGVSAPEKM